jgi:hypothetical protein
VAALVIGQALPYRALVDMLDTAQQEHSDGAETL